MQKADGSTYVHPYNIDLVERYAQISVNGGESETVYFKNTLSWDTFKTVNVQLELQQGANTVKIYNDNSYQFSNLVNSTAPEIDTITVSKLSSSGNKAELVEGAPSVQHDYTETVCKHSCTEQGYTEHTCTICGKSYKSDYVDATGHNYEAVVIAPTCTEQGYTAYVCIYCEDISYKEAFTPAIGHAYALSGFSKGIIEYSCIHCKDSYNERFEDYLNSTDDVTLDVNKDGIVNGKDYAYLKQQYAEIEPE